LKAFSNIVKKVHLFLGITCGVLASISGLTGSMYVWQPEITSALNQRLLQRESTNTLSEKTLLKTSSELYRSQKDTIAKIFLPYREQETVSIIYKNGQTLYYHPETGAPLGKKSASIKLFEDLLKIHRSLGIPKIGKYIVGSSAIIFFLFLLTSGLFLWWKKYKSNFKKGIKIKWKRNRKRFNYDVHKSLGIFFSLPLAVMAFSGGYFTYNSYYKDGLKLIDGFIGNKQPEKKIEAGTGIDILHLLETPDNQYALRAIYFPQDGNEVYQFRYIKNRFINPGLRKTRELKLDNNSNTIYSSSFNDDPVSEQIAAQFYPIHIGEMAGMLGRILVFISGFVPLILFITGLRFYYFRTVR